MKSADESGLTGQRLTAALAMASMAAAFEYEPTDQTASGRHSILLIGFQGWGATIAKLIWLLSVESIAASDYEHCADAVEHCVMWWRCPHREP